MIHIKIEGNVKFINKCELKEHFYSWVDIVVECFRVDYLLHGD